MHTLVSKVPGIQEEQEAILAELLLLAQEFQVLLPVNPIQELNQHKEDIQEHPQVKEDIQEHHLPKEVTQVADLVPHLIKEAILGHHQIKADIQELHQVKEAIQEADQRLLARVMEEPHLLVKDTEEAILQQQEWMPRCSSGLMQWTRTGVDRLTSRSCNGPWSTATGATSARKLAG